jgi:hypothetical protein
MGYKMSVVEAEIEHAAVIPEGRFGKRHRFRSGRP